MTLEVLDVSRKVLMATMEFSGSQVVATWRRGGDVSQAEPGTDELWQTLTGVGGL
jgi:hypothetical protein